MDPSLGKMIIGAMSGRNSYLEVPVEFQMGLLGLDDNSLRGKRGLDIGCGKGKLVEHLRGLGCDFEGIDGEVETPNDYLMRQMIYGTHPMEGAIPRPDNHYGLAVSFQNYSLNRALTLSGEVKSDLAAQLRQIISPDRHDEAMEQQQDLSMNGQFIVYEALRVVSLGQRVVFYPSLTRLDELMGFALRQQGVRFFTEEVDRGVADRYIKWESDYVGIGEPIDDEEICKRFGIYDRTILMKAA